MPKSKATVSSSESGSESDNDKPVAKKQKKEKKAEKAKEEGSGFKNDQGEMMFDLGKMKHVTVREFRGKTLIDIREFYNNSDGELKPGKKGISLLEDQWNALKKVMSEVDDAVAAM